MFDLSMKKIIRGYINIIEECNPGDGLYINYEVLSEQLKYLKTKNVTARFYISDTEKTIDELKQNLIKCISGDLYADYGDCYSEYTGYLYTTDELKIGEHDLLFDLYNYDGKFCYLELEVF